ncbi:growth inhibitor PemK [Pseudocitrobacter faecalis]
MARSKAVTVWLDGDSTDTGKITGVVLCYQLRALDLLERKARYASTVSPWVMDEILGMVVDLIDPQ